MRKLALMGSLLIAGLVGAFWWQWPDDNLTLTVCDVGQGDSVVITRGFSQVVIDGGPGNGVLSCLGRAMPFWDRTIEMVVMTHPQADHMDGLVEVVRRFKVETFVAPGVAGEAESFADLVEGLRGEEAKMVVPKKGDKFRLAGMSLRVLWPPERVGGKEWWAETIKMDQSISEQNTDIEKIDDLNQVSVVVELEYGEFEALLTGDIGRSEELALIADGVITRVEVLKVAHHGSKFSTSEEFLESARPELAVISVGGRNRFGHPTSDTLSRLDAIGAEIVRTDEVGDVVVVSDGENYWVEK